jgi:chromosome partitioning protein
MIIDISHQKGGTGKSTIAYNLAEAYRRQNKKVTLYDLDLQHTCIGINGLRDNPHDDILTIDSESGLINIINSAPEDEIIIIDSGGFDSSLTRLAIMGADINLTPVADKVTELLAVIQKYSVILEEIERDIGEQIKSYILLNKIHIFAENLGHIEEMIKENPRFEILQDASGKPLMIRDRPIYNKSFIDGRSVHEATDLKGSEYAAEEIDALSERLLNIYKQRMSNE